MRAERGGHARACLGRGGHLRDVLLDVIAAAEEQGDEDRLAGAQAGERVGEQGFVQFDVAQVDRKAGALFADAVQERADGAQGARVTAAVRHDDERGGPGRRLPLRETRLSWLASWLLIRFMRCAVLSRWAAGTGWAAPGLDTDSSRGGFDGVMDRWWRREVATPLHENDGRFPAVHREGCGVCEVT